MEMNNYKISGNLVTKLIIYYFDIALSRLYIGVL